MVFIACTSACVYQSDGCCTLERAAASGLPAGENACVNYVPRPEPASAEQSAEYTHKRS